MIEFVIQVTYPPNADRSDFDKMLDELIAAAAKYGLGVDGFIRSGEDEGAIDTTKMTLDTFEIEYDDEYFWIRNDGADGVLMCAQQGGSIAHVAISEGEALELAEWLVKALKLKVVRQ